MTGRIGAALIMALAAAAIAPVAAPARSIAQDLDVAQRYWQTDICRGQWKVIPDATLRLRGALASTWMQDCTMWIDPELEPCDREASIRHEVGHFIHGPRHVGPMSPEALNDVPCVGERLMQARVKARWLTDRARVRRWWRQ